MANEGWVSVLSVWQKAHWGIECEQFATQKIEQGIYIEFAIYLKYYFL